MGGMDDTTGPAAAQHSEPPQVTPPAPRPPKDGRDRRYRGMLIAGVTVLAVGLGCTGVGIALTAGALSRQAAATQYSTQPGLYRHGEGNGDGTSGSDGGGTSGGFGGYGFRQGAQAPSSATPATDAQKVGVVTVVSKIGYDGQEQAAGTGVILTSGGRILTNNHVVEGSTSIEVTVESSDATYRAEVVGTDATDDVAVLQLVTASGDKVTGLTAAKIDRNTLSVGDAITDVGNAKGTGNLVAAAGTVGALDQSIQVSDDTTGQEKSLGGLIELDAAVVAGDSGGPVLDALGEVTGIATAASSGSADVTGYAIPISTALSVVDKIVAGQASSSIVIGLPAFLGVEIASDQSSTGVAVAGAIAGTPAASAGIDEGSTITAVNGAAVDSSSLSSTVASHRVGDQVTISWTDASGVAHQATVTLIAGPAA